MAVMRGPCKSNGGGDQYQRRCLAVDNPLEHVDIAKDRKMLVVDTIWTLLERRGCIPIKGIVASDKESTYISVP